MLVPMLSLLNKMFASDDVAQYFASRDNDLDEPIYPRSNS